jgi:hypothetical protein
VSSASAPLRRFTPELLATILVVAVYIASLLSLPAWPSQDGPVHLYYTHVLGALLSHQPTPYTRFYTIKHLLPPYALYYYALLTLSKAVPLLMADRLIVCAYVVLFVSGFRYVAQTVGPSADLMTLLATLLALNWSVGMGFVNFCLALALALWAIGVWLRLRDARLAPRAIFLLLVAAITLTHPVSLVLLLAFCGVDVVQRMVWRQTEMNARRAPLGIDMLTLGISSLAAIYVWLFTAAHPLQQTQASAHSFGAALRSHVEAIVRLHHLMLLYGSSAPLVFYRVALLAIPLIGLALAGRQRLRNGAARKWTPGDTWLVLSLALIIIVPALPSDISNAYFFTERLTILLWIVPLLAASGWSPMRGRRSFSVMGIAVLAVAANISLLWTANKILRPIAAQVTPGQEANAPASGELALVLEDSRAPFALAEGPSWNPYYWAPVHRIRQESAVLDNAPWLNSAIIPLGATEALPGATLDEMDSISPSHLSSSLRETPEIRAQVLAPLNLVFIEQPGLPAPAALDPVLAGTGGWVCHVARAGWYQRCARSHS